MSNKRLGNKFEVEFCELLHSKGWWALNISQNQLGQPADIVAVKDGKALLIDCKVCSSDRFVLSRVEPNQEISMTRWHKCNNGTAYFALKTSQGVYMLPFEKVRLYLANDVKSLNLNEIKKNKEVGVFLTE